MFVGIVGFLGKNTRKSIFFAHLLPIIDFMQRI